MTTRLHSSLQGVDHVAYVTWKPAETVHFYRDILGFHLEHCILAPGWGNEPQPDFAHFFFDIGGPGGRLAFFYYFGAPPYDDEGMANYLKKARHLALLVDTEAELDEYQRRIEAGGYHLRHRVMHELIESIYVYDPNGYNLEFTRRLRPLTDRDQADTDLSIAALIDVSGGPEPTLEKVWKRKAELALELASVTVRG